ncbi:MAG: diguanylate cyclase (GGDEF)-like protein/PAS domain S-box-containing protein, partial [Myxococcota bacterium]
DSRDMVSALSMGANDYLTKPIDYPVALARIKTQLDRKRAEDRLRESEERYALAMSGANDGLWDWDIRSGIVFYSERWQEMLGAKPAEVEPHPESWLSRVHATDYARVRAALSGHLEGRLPQFEAEYRIRHDDGHYVWVLSRGIAVRNGAGVAYRMAGSLTDITERKIRDPLTGLANGALLAEHLARALETCRRKGCHFGLLLLNIDRFTMISGQVGHSGSDRLLRNVGTIIGRNLRSIDTVARMDADVFAVLVEDIVDPQQVARLARRIQRAFGTPLEIEGHEIIVKLNLGVVVGNDYADVETAITDATTALARADTEGIGGVQLFDPSMHSSALARLQLETDLHRGVARQEFMAYFQPVMSMATGAIVGFEALARWAHPTRGMVSPAEFIPVAEETGVIAELGKIVLKLACQQLGAWNSHMPDFPVFVAVNVSARQLTDSGFIDYLAEVLQGTGAPPERLKLEITESAVMAEADTALELLARARELGVKVAIDDFGTGHSSLSYLHQLPADTLKIDQSFIRQMAGDLEKADVVRTIMILAHSLGMNVVAEGIETVGDLAALRALKCDMGQGYLFAKPLPPTQALSLLRDRPTW